MGVFNWKNNANTDPRAAARTKTVLTSAQVLSLFTTPVVLVPAPGANYYIDVISVVVTLNYNSVAYAGANALQISYTNGAGAAATTSNVSNAFLNAGVTAGFKTAGKDAVTPVAGAPLVASVLTANPTAGNSTLLVDVVYRIAQVA
jgi:Flp pilus assembly protein TadG